MPSPAPSRNPICPECGTPADRPIPAYIRALHRSWPSLIAIALFILLTLAFIIARNNSPTAITSHPLSPFVEEWNNTIYSWSFTRSPGITIDAFAINITRPIDSITNTQSQLIISITAIQIWLVLALIVFLIPFPIRRRHLTTRAGTRRALEHCINCNYPLTTTTFDGSPILTLVHHRREARTNAPTPDNPAPTPLPPTDA